MQVLLYAAFFGAFTWFVVTVQNRRRLMAVTLAGVMVVTLVGAPQPAQAQIGILQAIQAVLNVINGVIQTALNCDQHSTDGDEQSAAVGRVAAAVDQSGQGAGHAE